MRTLIDLYREGGAARDFVTEFVSKPHSGDWEISKDHWSRMVQYISNEYKDLEEMSPRQAQTYAENRSMQVGLMLALRYQCWACGAR